MQNITSLINTINTTHKTLKICVSSAVNVTLTVRNWLVGYYIINYEQNGNDRAEYGAKTLQKLAENLNSKDGFSYRNLQLYRQFFTEYQNLFPAIKNYILQLGAIAQPLVAQLPQNIENNFIPAITEQYLTDNQENEIAQSLIAQFKRRDDLSFPPEKLLYKLSFTHFVQLLGINDALKRAFYELECVRGTWNVRELQRQINTWYYERSGLSKNKEKLSEIINEKTSKLEPQDVINAPFVFEFLGLNTSALVNENDIEQALIDNLQQFLLELGTGFCFEARQKRILIGDEYFFIDLVLYHRLLKCHVIIELKTDKFQQHFISQLDTYLNFYKAEIQAPDDNPPIGILLCTHKNNTLVKYATASLDKKIFVQKYMLKLPKAEEIEQYIQKFIK